MRKLCPGDVAGTPSLQIYGYALGCTVRRSVMGLHDFFDYHARELEDAIGRS